MNRVIKVLLLLVLASSAVAAQKDIAGVQSWRTPTTSDLGAPEDQKWREADPARYLVVTGDFDGDGKLDEARIVVRGDGKAFAIVVKLASRKVTIKLDEFPDIKTLTSTGIKRVAPASYPTACAKGYDCAEDEPRYISVKHDAIDYFQHDATDRYYYWNDARHAFAQVGING
jgi:hypothetical protein